MNAIADKEDVLKILYDGVAFHKHAQTIQDVRDEFSEMEDLQRDKLGPILDVLSRGIYTLVKDVYEYGKDLSSDKQDSFSVVEDGLVMTAYSFFNFRKGVYKDLEKVHSAIANEKLSSDLHVPGADTVMLLLSAVKSIINLEDGERDKAIELGDTVLRGMYHASESIYNPEIDPDNVIGSGSDNDFPTDKYEVLPKLADIFKR